MFSVGGGDFNARPYSSDVLQEIELTKEAIKAAKKPHKVCNAERDFTNMGASLSSGC